MPLFIDIHEIPGVTSEVAAAEHIRDIDAQGPFAVDYTRYWLNEATGKIFCMCEAPTAEAAMEVHRLAHGAPADKIIEVTPELTELFLGPVITDPSGAVLLPGDPGGANDPATRTIMFTDIVNSTALTQLLGDDASMEIVEAHDTIVRRALAAAGGRQVKHTGDGIMAVFISAATAIRAATEIQKDIAADSAANPDRAFELRIGVAAGEPVDRHNDLFRRDGTARGAPLRARSAGPDPRLERRARPLYRKAHPFRRERRRCAQGFRRSRLRANGRVALARPPFSEAPSSRCARLPLRNGNGRARSR